MRRELDRSRQLDRLLAPSSVAVVGASTRDGWGLKTIQNLEAVGFTGEIFPVNPRYDDVGGHRCFASLKALPSPPDAAVFAIPAAAIPDGIAEAIECGIPSAVVYASGFGAAGQGEGGDAGDAGPRRRLSELCRGQIAVLGPNCLGSINYARRSACYGISMPYSHAGTEHGIALVAQSGNMALTLSTASRGVAFTHVISCGNQLDVTAAELLSACLRDPAVRSLAALVEGVPDVDRLTEVLVDAAERDVPVIVLKVGESERGQAATVAHTGTLSGSSELHRAYFRQFGAIQVGDLDELLAVAALMSAPRRPRGRGVAVFASSGGECGLIADLSESMGVVLPELPDTVADSVLQLLPSFGRASNPLDITAGGWGDAELYASVVEELSQVEGVATVVSVADSPTIEGPEMAGGFAGIVNGLAEGNRRVGPNGPTVALLDTIGDVHAAVPVAAAASGVVPLVGLRSGLFALGKAGWYADWRRARRAGAEGDDEHVGAAERAASRSAVTELLARQPDGPIAEDLAKQVLGAYEVASPARAVAHSREEAVGAARAIGYPVVLKLAVPGVAHKTDVGGVLVGLGSDADVQEGASRLLALGESILARRSTGADGAAIARSAVLVERLVPAALELIAGGRRDETFGPIVMVGLGGVLTELLGDVALRLAPIAAAEAAQMIDELAGRRLLDGYRGTAGVDLDGLARTVAAVSQLLADHDRIAELDVNPLVSDPGTGRLTALDALIVLSS